MRDKADLQASFPSSGQNSGKDRLKIGYRPDIDGLRAVAVLAVIANHFTDKLLPGGYLGVDVFFVISGFVVLASVSGRSHDSFAQMVLEFYARRVKRILPALAVFVVLAGFLVCLLMPDPGVVLGIGKRALFGVSNLQLYRQSAQYFSESIKLNPYVQTWSLGVEEQFYLLFPLLIALCGCVGFSERGRRNLFLAIGALSIASLGLFVYLYSRDQPAAYFLLPSRYWEMGAGSLLFLSWVNWRERFAALPLWVPGGAAAVLIVAFTLPLSLAVPATILAVAATGALIVSIPKNLMVSKALTHPYLVGIGLLSYSLYLWHWGVLALSRLTIGVEWWTSPLQILLIAALSYGSYRFVEQPFRRSRWPSSHGLAIAVGSLGLLAASAILSLFAFALADRIYLAKFKGNDFVYVQKDMDCELMSLRPGRSQWKDCLRRRSQNPYIFVLGDSHASNLVPSLKEAARHLGFADVLFLTNAMPHAFHTKETSEAAQFWNGSASYRRLIESLRAQDLVVYSRSMTADSATQKEWHHQLGQLVSDVPGRGAKLVLVDDIPKTCGAEDFRRSFLFSAGKGCPVKKSEALAHRVELTRFLTSFSRGRRDVFYVDPLPALCESIFCYPTLNKRILYADNSPHFSRSNPAPLASFFVDQFERFGLSLPSPRAVRR